jgi:tRNA(Ile2) C34 agmatinyltransferase TiaS
MEPIFCKREGLKLFEEKDGKVLLGAIEINEAKRLKEKLSTKNINIDLVHNETTCKKGCVARVEAWAETNDIEAIQKMIHEENMHMIMSEGTDVDPEQIHQVFDDEAETAICPACGTSFSTKLKECPDCGLVFFNE